MKKYFIENRKHSLDFGDTSLDGPHAHAIHLFLSRILILFTNTLRSYTMNPNHFSIEQKLFDNPTMCINYVQTRKKTK